MTSAGHWHHHRRSRMLRAGPPTNCSTIRPGGLRREQRSQAGGGGGRRPHDPTPRTPPLSLGAGGTTQRHRRSHGYVASGQVFPGWVTPCFRSPRRRCIPPMRVYVLDICRGKNGIGACLDLCPSPMRRWQGSSAVFCVVDLDVRRAASPT